MRLLFTFAASLCAASAFAASSTVSQNDMGAAWPLTVKSGVLACQPLDSGGRVQLVTFTAADGKTYAVNGTAKGHAKSRGWLEIRPIWKDDPAIPGLKISIGPLIDRGLALCR